MSTKAFAAQSATTPLEPMTITRREPLPSDVEIDILYCGVCHSDLHLARNEWGMTAYPLVPGHEILGRVTRVGEKISKFKVGDIAAVGCLVDSCGTCSSCADDLEQFCLEGPVFSYGWPDKHSGGMTHGGYYEMIVCDEAFTLKVPTNLDPASAAPLLCAGITSRWCRRYNVAYPSIRLWLSLVLSSQSKIASQDISSICTALPVRGTSNVPQIQP